MVKGIIFDLYGTLIDASHLFSGVAIEISIQTNIDSHKVEERIIHLYRQFFKDYHLLPFKPEKDYYLKLFEVLKDEYNLMEDTEWYVNFMYNTFTDLKAFDDISFLDILKEKGIKIAILSNADAYFVRKGLEKQGIYYDELIISEEVEMYKPDIKIFDLALQKINMTKDEVIFVGDNLDVDIKGGNDSGIETVLIDRFNMHEYEPRVNTLYGLKNYIE